MNRYKIFVYWNKSVAASTKLALNYIYYSSSMQLVSKITLATYDFNKHLT